MRFSGRIPLHLEANGIAEAVAQRRAEGLDLVDLTLSNPTRCGFQFPEEPLLEALAHPNALIYSPDAQGVRVVREAVARHHQRGVDADQIVLSASTSEAYGWLFKLLADPGTEVLVPAPSYPLFDWLAALEGIHAVPVPSFWHDRWHLDLQALEAALTPASRAVVVVSPNNPTGQFLTRDEWQALTAWCAERELALIVDEVFSDYALEPSPDHLSTALDDPQPACPVFVLSGLSKVTALPQAKLGWIIAWGEAARPALEPLTFLADQYLSVSAGAQALAPVALAHAETIQASIRARLRTNLHRLDAWLEAHPHLSRLPVEGGWSVVLRMPALEPSEQLAERLVRERGVLVHPGPFFGLPEGHLVLSLLTPRLEDGLGRLAGSL